MPKPNRTKKKKASKKKAAPVIKSTLALELNDMEASVLCHAIQNLPLAMNDELYPHAQALYNRVVTGALQIAQQNSPKEKPKP